MTTLAKDVRYGLRMLIVHPGLTSIVVLSLALGIGASTIIFTLINAMFLRPLPGRNPERLASIYISLPDGSPYGSSSYPDYRDLRDENEVFVDLAAYVPQLLWLGSDDRTDRITAEFVSRNFFHVLGVSVALGRSFLSEDESTHPFVAILSHRLWQRQFGGDPGIIGQSITLNGQPVTVIGITSKEFAGLPRGIAIDAWLPLDIMPQLTRQPRLLTERGSMFLSLIGRLKPGVTLDQARANLRLLGQRLARAHPRVWRNARGVPRTVTILSERESRVPAMARRAIIGFLMLLAIVVGLVLVIACVNVANLLLARAMGRRREMAIRLALGASRFRLIRQLLVESVLLSLLAGLAGVVIAYWAKDLLWHFHPPLPFDLALDLRLDGRVLLFTLGIATLTGLSFGLAPAWEMTKLDLASSLKEGEAGIVHSHRRSTFRNALIVVQVAASLILLVAANLFLRSLARAELLNPGFDPENVLLVTIDLEAQGYGEAEGKHFYEQLRERLLHLPGVVSASMAQSLPLGPEAHQMSVSVEGTGSATGNVSLVHYNVIGLDYFKALRIPIVRGRAFAPGDGERAPQVVIVNETFARRHWPGQDPIGKRLALGYVRAGDRYPLQVVGVAKDSKYISWGEEPRPFIYLPYQQHYRSTMTAFVRTTGDPRALIPTLRRELRSLDPDLLISEITTLREHIAWSLIPMRLAAALLSVLGSLVLVLAVIGIHGVISYSVNRRTHEIGVRLALGAQPHDVFKLIIGQGLRLTVMGMVIGLAVALLTTRFLRSFLYEISPTDPLAFAAICGILLVVAIGAAYFPARRAARLDPMVTLRYE